MAGPVLQLLSLMKQIVHKYDGIRHEETVVQNELSTHFYTGAFTIDCFHHARTIRTNQIFRRHIVLGTVEGNMERRESRNTMHTNSQPPRD
jgi:hypothetical protein